MAYGGTPPRQSAANCPLLFTALDRLLEMIPQTRALDKRK
jgi:hypothetical protein